MGCLFKEDEWVETKRGNAYDAVNSYMAAVAASVRPSYERKETSVHVTRSFLVLSLLMHPTVVVVTLLLILAVPEVSDGVLFVVTTRPSVLQNVTSVADSVYLAGLVRRR